MEVEISQINSAIESIDREIAELRAKRTRLCQRLNSLQSTARNIPPEILTEIFRLSASKSNIREPKSFSIDLRQVLKLGSISSQWRRIAWSSPQLWTTCLLSDDPIPPFIISLIFSNSRGSSVSAKADLDELSLESIELLFHRYRTRIRVLHVYLPDDEYEASSTWDDIAPFFKAPAEWPSLSELSVWLPEMTPISGLLLQPDGDGALQRCKFKHENVSWNIPMKQITILRLSHFPIDQCLYLLLQCENIEEFHCIDPSTHSPLLFSSSTLLTTSERPRVIPNVKVFRWKSNNDNWNYFLFTSIRFPNLERLCWGDPHIFNRLSQDWGIVEIALVNHFMPSVENIAALDWDTKISSFLSFENTFSKTSLQHLQELTITEDSSSNFIAWLRMLTLRHPSSRTLLPALRVFHARVSSVELGNPRVFNAVNGFLNSRIYGPISEDPSSGAWVVINPPEHPRTGTRLEIFRLETDESPLLLDERQVGIIRRLISGGLTFEVFLPREDGTQDRTTTLG
ncbi:hypothetical protein NP233_g9480 [Leucocoprinus birnbaumii]|uniref:F-box domain-containing protein n=1 Tax=Leucocoprinus birnbaumii TaxID=56174 RepID=A0AAD5VKZ9_9AGAR|nr:hypothetical protein NP233_g9480 [Leucocoprinus birnbaumii]